MAPTADHITPTGVTEVPTVLGGNKNDTSAQPLIKGEETKPCLSEIVAGPNADDIESSRDQGTTTAEQQTPTDDAPNHTDTGKPKKKKKKGVLKRGPTALTRNRGTGFEGKCSIMIPMAKKTDQAVQDFYCDPPMTPEEAEEERNEIYAT